jgi:V/A-type H+-transporting ATPase subunit I
MMMNRRHSSTRLFPMLFQGGLAAIPVGVFMGAWFGMDYASLPGFLQAPADLLNRLVPGFVPGEAGQEGFSVSKQFLYLALGLGIVQILVGVVVNLVKRLRDGQGMVAIADQAGWFLATIGLFPWLFNHYLLNGALYDLNGPVDRVFTTMLAVGAVLIFIIGGREARGFGKIGLGAYAAYGIVNLLGDVLSYSRLFALSLSGGIIAQVVNQIAGMLRTQVGIPVVGILLSVIVLAGGHLFNLAMGCLSGFIHTTRLQFVEFFTKFYEGTGVPFRPLRYHPRFIHIDRDQ